MASICIARTIWCIRRMTDGIGSGLGPTTSCSTTASEVSSRISGPIMRWANPRMTSRVRAFIRPSVRTSSSG